MVAVDTMTIKVAPLHDNQRDHDDRFYLSISRGSVTSLFARERTSLREIF